MKRKIHVDAKIFAAKSKSDGFIRTKAIFSTREKAEAYINRFPDMGNEYFVEEEERQRYYRKLKLDPKFLSFPDRSIYCLLFTDRWQLRHLSEGGSYRLDREALERKIKPYREGQILHLIAKSRRDALRQFVLIRNGLGIKGERATGARYWLRPGAMRKKTGKLAE